MEWTRSHTRKGHDSNNNKKKKKKEKNNDKKYLPTCSSLRITFTSSCKMACDLEESELTPVAPVLRTPPPYSITCTETTSSVVKTVKQVLKFVTILEITFQVSICSVKAQMHSVMGLYYCFHYYTSINSSTLWTCRSVNPAMHTWWLASSLANNLQNI